MTCWCLCGSTSWRDVAPLSSPLLKNKEGCLLEKQWRSLIRNCLLAGTERNWEREKTRGTKESLRRLLCLSVSVYWMCVTPGDRSVRLSWVLGTIFVSLSCKRHVADNPGASVHISPRGHREGLWIWVWNYFKWIVRGFSWDVPINKDNSQGSDHTLKIGKWRVK